METKQFDGYNCDLVRLQETIEIYFTGRGFRVTNFHRGTTYLNQAYKDELRTKSLFIRIVGTPERFEVAIGQGKRINSIQNFPSALDKTSFFTKLRIGELRLESDFWNFITTQIDLQRNTYGLKKPFMPFSPPFFKEREVVREIEVIYCRYCGTKNNARRTTCTKCGGNLH